MTCNASLHDLYAYMCDACLLMSDKYLVYLRVDAVQFV